jgi:toxin YoeB
MKRHLELTPKALDDFTEWATYEPKMMKRIARLFEEICRSPFDGTGKPEPLKANLSGCWSRRITDEHRLVYGVADALITVYSLRGHYED